MGAEGDVADQWIGVGGGGVASEEDFGGLRLSFPHAGFAEGGEVVFVVFDLVFAEDEGAGDGVGGVFLRGLEGDVVAEAWGLDDEEVGAGAGFFDQGDAVGGVLVAVELSNHVLAMCWPVRGGL